MIRSFSHKGLRRFFISGTTAGINPDHAPRLRLILAMLDEARSVLDTSAPGMRLHPLKGKYKGSWAVTVRANWRVTFRFDDGDVQDVDYVDYH